MITYRQQWAIVQEIKKEPEIKKKRLKRNIVLLFGILLPIFSFCVLGFGFYFWIKSVDFEGTSINYDKLKISSIIFIALEILGLICLSTQKRMANKLCEDVGARLKATIIADANATDAKNALTDSERMEYLKEKKREETNEIAVVKKYYTWCWASCMFPLMVAALCLLFIPGIAVLGIEKTSLFELIKELFKNGYSGAKNTVLGLFLGLDGERINMLRMIAFVEFIFMGIYCFVYGLLFAWQISHGQKNVEKIIRTKDQKVLDTFYMNALPNSFFSYPMSFIRVGFGMAVKAVIGLAFPIMFFNYLEDFCIVERYMLIIPIVLIVLDVILCAGKKLYACKNKKVLQAILPLFYTKNKNLNFYLH